MRSPRGGWRRLSVLASVAGCAAVVAVAIPSAGSGTAQQANAATAGSAFTTARTVTRDAVATDGSTIMIDSRNITATVSQTTDLQDQQVVHVSWSGAHPTGAIVADPSSWADADSGDAPWSQEYPMVLMQCRGVDDTSAPVSQQLSPQTCWTEYPTERFDALPGTDYPAWRLDQYATAADRGAHGGRPASVAACDSAPIDHWLSFDSADGTEYPTGGNPAACGTQAPEGAPNPGIPPLPSNTVYAVTGTDGSGSSNFEVRTANENESLGCTDTVPCSLVMVPIMGISCDANLLGQDADGAQAGIDALSACESGGEWPAGSRYSTSGPSYTAAHSSAGQAASLSVSGKLWWSASNWRNRISIPLQLLPPDNACDIHDSRTPVDVYGSELLGGATDSWAPHFCLDASLFHFRHVRIGEPTADNLLAQGLVNATFVSDAPAAGFTNPTALAPVAITGFAITFQIDDKSGQLVSSLKLTPRLLAKLLSESYPGTTDVKASEPALAHNPLNISDDPEFVALNPGIPSADYTVASSTLLSISSDSDVMSSLSAYMNADPEAREFLNGMPDPWGMVVNPSYKGIVLPVTSWPLLDPVVDAVRAAFPTTQGDTPSPEGCYAESPAPVLSLYANPELTLTGIGLDMLRHHPTDDELCAPLVEQKDGTYAPLAFARASVQQAGLYFMIGLMSVSDADKYSLPMAALQTQVSPTAAAKFSNAAGRSFVAPSVASMRVAASYLTPSASAGLWPLPYTTWHTATGGAGAYPGTMVVYGAFPTTGLTAQTATDLATFLRFTSTSGQVSGTGVGQLPAGYLPMTTANGVGGLAAYALTAADAVQNQAGVVPALIPVAAPGPTASTKPAAAKKSTAAKGTATVAKTSTAPVAAQGGQSAPALAGAPSASSTARVAPPGASPPAVIAEAPATTLASTRSVSSGASWILPLLLVIGVGSAGIVGRYVYGPSR